MPSTVTTRACHGKAVRGRRERAVRTQVGIVGAGPAGLMLSHLLYQRGIDSVVIDLRSRAQIEQTITPAVLEQGTVDLITRTGVGDRLHREGSVQHGINLAFAGELHRIDLHALTGGRSITVYPRHELLQDLIGRRLADRGDLRFGVTGTSIEGIEGDRPTIRFAHHGRRHRLDCDFVVGCDGSQSLTRYLIPERTVRTDFFRQYPFAWFGVLAEGAPSSDELTYVQSERGFALITAGSPTAQRLYFQCSPQTDPDDWSADRIWDEIQARVGGSGTTIRAGTILEKQVLQFRSFVCEPMQYGRLFLAGESAHTVPPIDAKGLNLAIADVHVLDRALGAHFETGDGGPLQRYTETVLRRIWQVQHFSWWMTSMLDRFSDATEDELHRQLDELELLVNSRSAATTLAENYVGLPLD